MDRLVERAAYEDPEAHVPVYGMLKESKKCVWLMHMVYEFAVSNQIRKVKLKKSDYSWW